VSKRVFAMSGFKGSASNDINERQARIDLARQSMLDMVRRHPKAEEMGLTEQNLDNVHQFINGLAGDRAPTLRHGPSFEARVDGGDTISLTDDYTNAHGERVLEGYRRNGPRLERVRIAEERVNSRTVIVTRRVS
jgi:hypothetical protein